MLRWWQALERDVAIPECWLTRPGFDPSRIGPTGYGPTAKIGVEGNGAYGSGLARHLMAAGLDVIEINRPDRPMRPSQEVRPDRRRGYGSGRAGLSGEASLTPKDSSPRAWVSCPGNP